MTNFDFSTDNITDGKSVNMQASMHVNMPDTGLDVDVSTDLIANNLLSESGADFFIKDLDIDGLLNSESKMPLKISLIKEAKLDLAKDTLNLLKMSIKLGNAEIITNVDGSNITKNSSLQGSYQIDSFDFNAFITQLTGSPLVTNDELSDFHSNGKWLLSGDRLKLENLQIAFSKTSMQGSADIKNLDQLKGQFNLKINQLNVDDFLGDESNTSETAKTASSEEMDFGVLTGTVEIDKLTASGTTMNNIKMKIQTNNSKMSISPIRADFYKGQLSTEVLIDTKATKDRVKVQHKMDKIQAGPLLTDVMGSELMTGLGNFDLDINIDQPFSDIPLKSSHGRIDFSLGDGAIYGVDVFGMMNQGLSLLYPEEMQAKQDGVKKTTFALMKFVANIDQGILTTETLSVDSPYLKIRGKLTINLFDQTIDGTIEPMLIDIPDELVSDKYKKLLNLPIPVSLSGSLLDPSVKIDAAKLLLATQKQKIDKEKEKLKGKLFDSLFGKDKKDKKDSGN
jgi:AsmA protein